MMRMKSETIAEASEPSSMGSFASSSNNNDDDHATEIHHVVAGRASDAVLEDVDDDSGEGGSVEQQVGGLASTVRSTEFPIPSFVRFRHVLFWEFPCPAWAVASCRSGPQAGGTLINLAEKPL